MLSNAYAPQGYAYVIAVNDMATIATVATKDFADAKLYLQRAIDFFAKEFQLTIEQPEHFACVGNVGILRPRRIPYTGESGGFQDALAGFGMRYAVRSGFLAAQAIIEGKDFWRETKRELVPWVKASMVNRFFVDMFANPIYDVLIHRFANRDTRLTLQKIYKPTLLKRLLYPATYGIYKYMQRKPMSE